MRRLRGAGRFSTRLNLIREAVGASAVRERLRARPRAAQAHCHAVLVDALENRTLLSTVPGPTTTFDQNITGPTALNQNINYSSPSISYDPNNPLDVVEASVQDNPNAGGTQKVFIQLAYSTNGGTAWTNISSMVPANAIDPLNSTKTSSIPYSEATDVTVAFDRNENFYVTYSEHDASNNSGAIVLQQFEFNAGAPAIDPTNKNIGVYQWAGADFAYTPTMAVDTNQPTFTDPRAGGATQADPYSGNIYVAWATNDTAPTGAPNNFNPDRAVLAVSQPGSLTGSYPNLITFSPPMTVNTANQYQGNTGGNVATPQIVISQGDISGAVTPGQVTVVWDNTKTNTIESSPADGGVSGADYSFPLGAAPVQNANAQLFTYYDALTVGPNPEPASFNLANPYANPTETYPSNALNSVDPAGDNVSFIQADLNSDSIQDLIVLDKTAATVKIYLGVGDAGFVLDKTLTGFTNPEAVAAGDFDGDNKVDLLVIDKNGLNVFTGDAGGGFTPTNGGQAWTASGPDFNDTSATWNVQAGKIDSDNISDLAITDSSSANLFIATDGYAPTLPENVAALSAALTSGTPYTSLSVSALSAGVPSGATITLGTGANTITVTLAAAAAKGATTLTIASYTPSATIASGTAVASSLVYQFNFIAPYPLTGTNPQSLVLQDVNGDNKLDAVVGDGNLVGDVEVFSGSLLTAAAPQVTPAGHAVTQILVNDVNTDNKLDITALTSSGISVLLSGGGSFTLSGTTAQAGIVAGTYGAVEGTSADDLVIIDSSGYLEVLKPVIAGGTVTFTNATTINFPTDSGTPNPTALINYPSDQAQRFDLLVFNDDTGALADYVVPKTQGTVAVGTDFDIPVNITDPNFVVSNVALDFAVTDAFLDQVAAELIGPDGTSYWLFLNQDVGTTPNNAVPVWSSQDTVYGPLANDTIAQGITNPNSTPGIGYVNSSGDQLDVQIDDQATRSINDPNVTDYVADFRQEEDLPNQQPALAFWGLAADSLESLDGKMATPASGTSAVNGGWILRFFTFEDFTSVPPPQQTLDNAVLIFTGSTVPQATPKPLGLIPTGAPNNIATSNVAGTLSNTGFNLKPASDPNGIGPGISVAEDNSLGIYSPYQERIYVAFTVANAAGTDTNIDLSYSDDGVNWTTTTVNANTTGWQFSPSIAVDQSTGTLVLTWYDASADSANARVAREIVTSTDGGNTFSAESYLNVSNEVYNAITGAGVNLGPIPDNISTGSAYNGSTGNDYSGFGASQGLVAAGGHVYAVWTGNQNGGPTGKNAMDILTSTTTYADGPRVLTSTEGVVSTPEDIVNPAVNNSPELQYIDITFDRPIVPSVGISYNPADPADFPFYFDPSAITIYYRNDSTPGTAPPTAILPENDILSIEPLNYGFAGNGLADPDSLYGEATTFRVALVPQKASGTYSYSITDPIIGGSYTIADGYINIGLGNFQAPYSVSATGSDTAALTVGVNTNLPVPAAGSTSTTSNILIPTSIPAADKGATIVDINVTVDLDGASDALSALSLFLVDPNGNKIPLSWARVGASQTAADIGVNSTIGGNGYISTVFDDQAATPVAFGNYQFSGTFKPDTSDGTIDAADGGAQGLGSFNGETLNVGGDWTLMISSNRPNNGVNAIGLLRDWSLQFTTATVGTYLGNAMDQNANAISGEAPQPLATSSEAPQPATQKLGGPATAPGTIGDAYVAPNPTSSNSYTLDAGGNYFAAPYDNATLPLIIPGPQVLTTRTYPATVSSGAIPVATNPSTPGTLTSTITIGGDTDVNISKLMVNLNLAALGDVHTMVIQLIYTPAVGFATLTSGLTNGQTNIMSLSVSALTTALPSGTNIVLISGGNTETVTLSADAAVGDITLSVNNFTSNAAYGAGTGLHSNDSIPITLTDEVAGGGSSFGGTIGGEFVPTLFTDDAETSIELDTNSSPYAGLYQPATPLSALNGQTLAGTYQLIIRNFDITSGNTATLNAWSISALTSITAVDPSSGSGLQSVEVYFTQPMNPASVVAAGATLVGPDGPISGPFTITPDPNYDNNFADNSVGTLTLGLSNGQTNITSLLVTPLNASLANGSVIELVDGSRTIDVTLAAAANAGDTTLTVNSFTANADYSAGTALVPDSLLTTLSVPLTSGQANITSVSINALNRSLPKGTVIELVSGNSTQYVTLSAAAAVGDGSLSVVSFTANANYASDTNVEFNPIRTFKVTFPSSLSLTGGYSLVLGSTGTEPASETGTLLDSDSNDGLEILRDESPSSSDRKIQVLAPSSSQNVPINKFNGASGIVQSTLQVGGVGGNTLTDITNPANPIVVTGNNQDFLIQGLTVTLQLNYPRATELSATLIAPDGTAIQLFSNLSSTGKLLSGDSIVFSDTSSVAITSGSAPFLGTFSPQEPLSYLNGLLATGTWTLQIKDNGANSGTLVSWSLKFTAATPDSGAGAEAGDNATVGFNVFNMGATNPQSHEVWNPIGGASNATGSQSASGPVTAIAVDPSDPSGNTVYVGAATGGVWKTTNFLTTDPNGPTYVPLTNFLGTDSSNIGSIAVLGSQTSPATSQTVPSMIFAATGELSDSATGADDNAPGAGILVSLDGGLTWTVSNDGGAFNGMIANKIIVDPNLQSNGNAIIYVAFSDPNNINGGVYTSTDSGATWTQLKQGNATDVAFEQNSGINAFQQGVSNPTHNLNTIVAAFEQNTQSVGGVFSSPNRGAIWTELFGTTGDSLILNNNAAVPVVGSTTGTTVSPNGNNGRIVLATPDLTGNSVQDLLYQGWIYAAVVSNTGNNNFQGEIVGLYMTKDYGQTWTRVNINYGTLEAGITGGAGNYAISLAVDPSDPNIVYLASSQYNENGSTGSGMIRIDTTGISDAHSFYQGETAADGGQLRINTTDVATANTAPTNFSTTLDQPTINLLQNPSQPFVTNATIKVGDITQFNNTGTGVTWIPFTGALDFTDTSNPSPAVSFYHTIVTEVDPLTGQSRLIFGTEQGVFTGVDEDGAYLTVDPNNQEPSGAATSTSLSQTPLGSRNGNLQIAEFYYGAVQPSQAAADEAGGLFYGNGQGIGLSGSTSDLLSTGDTSWSAGNVPSVGFGIATDPTGSGTVYQYVNPFESGSNTNFFQVNGVGRTSGLISPTDPTYTTNDPNWPDISKTGNGSVGYNFAVNPLDGNQIVISNKIGEVFSTQNAGETWSLISATYGIDGTPGVNGTNAATLAFGAPADQSANGTFIYAGTLSGKLYVTFTGGGGSNQTWSDISLPAGDGYVKSIAADPAPGTYDVYAITSTGVFYLANSLTAANSGTAPQWTDITNNLGTLAGITAAVPNNLTTMTADWRYATPVLYVGADSGVYRGVDNGGAWTWELFPNVATDSAPAEGGYLPNAEVTDLDLATGAIDPTTGLPHTDSGDPDALVATTFGRGAYAIRLAPIVSNTLTAVPSTLPFDKIISTGTTASPSYITNALTLTLSGSSEKLISGYNQALVSVYLLDANGNPTEFLGGYNPADTSTNPADPHSAFNTANIANANGIFSVTTTTALPDLNGNYSIGIRATDNAGVVGAFSKITVALEVQPPVISSLALTTASDSGPNTSDNQTNINTPTVVGEGAAGATATIYLNGVVQGTAIADSSGEFTYQFITPLDDGSYTVSASEVDALDNQSLTPNIQFTLVVDTSIDTPTAPALASGDDTGVSITDGVTNDNSPSFTGTLPVSDTADNGPYVVAVTVTPTSGSPITQTQTLADPTVAYSIPFTNLPDGSYSVTVTQTDVEGNVSAASPVTNVVIDTTAPIVFTVSPLPATSEFGMFHGVVANFVDVNGGGTATIDWGDTSPVDNLTYSATDPNSPIVHITGNTWELIGTHSYQSTGNFTVTVTVTDAAGNLNSGSSVTTTSVQVNPPAVTVKAPNPLLNAVYIAVGKPFDSVIATFSSGIVGEVYTLANTNITIDWGDGTQTKTSDDPDLISIVQDPNDVSGLTFDIIAPHSYPSAVHSYGVTVTVTPTDPVAGGTPGTGTITAAVETADQLITITPLAVSTEEGSTATQEVADITNAGLLTTSDFIADFGSTYLTDFSASVDWGDGTTTSTTDTDPTLAIVPDGTGGFFIEGTNAYADGVASPGSTYTITTTVTADGNVATPVTSTATVANVPPTTSITTGTSFGLVGQPLTFGLTTIDPGTTDTTAGFTYIIDWGDGTLLDPDTVTVHGGASFTTPSHTYTAIGTYPVTITATDKDGGVSDPSTAQQLVEIAQLVAGNNISAVDEGTALTNYVVAVIQGATSDPIIQTITVNWGDGTLANPDTDTNAIIVPATDGSGDYWIEDSHTYTDGPAIETITTSVLPAGASSAVSVTETATVDNVAPVLSIAPPTQSITGQSISMPLTTTDVGTQDTAAGFTYNIIWGDTSTPLNIARLANDGTGQSPTHTYTVAGNYTITAKATDKDGDFDTVTSAINVAGITAGTVIGSEGFSLLATTATITNTSTFITSQFSASINWGDGTSSAGTIVDNGDGTFSVNGTHTYADGPAASNEKVTTTVTFGSATMQASVTPTITNIVPTASIVSAPSEAIINQSITVSLGATDPGSADTSHGFIYNINWGDNTAIQTIGATTNNGTGQSPTHTYASAGDYVISVTATDKDGGISSAVTSDVQVAGISPVALSSSEGSAFNGAVATIINASTFVPSNFSATINWGDNTTGTGTIVSNGDGTFSVIGAHTYTDGPATDNVTVTVTFGSSTMQTTSTATIANVVPTASVSGPTFALASQVVSFSIGATDLGSADLAAGFSYLVTWGDGQSQTVGVSAGDNAGVTVTHAYSTSGNYTVSVTATDKDSGISTAATQSISIAGATVPTLGDIAEGSTFSGKVAELSNAGNYNASDLSATINWGDGSNTTGTVTADPNNVGSFIVTGTHTYGDGPATDTITVTINSASGSSSTTAAGTIKLDNIAPTVSLSGLAGGFINQTLGLTMTATDPSSADVTAGFTYNINWGDGSTQTIAASADNGSGVSLTHTYAALGNYTVSVTATDKDGGVSATASHAFDIVPNPQLENVVTTSHSIAFTLPQTTVPITSLDSSDFELVQDGSQNISLSGAPITFDPATGAVSIDTSGLNLGAGDYQLYVLPGTNITPALFTLGIDESALLTKTVKLNPGKKVNAPTLHFKKLTLGGAPDAPIVLILQNISTTQALTLSEFAFLSSGPFSFAVQGQPYGATQYTVAPGASLTVRVYYTPTIAGSSTTRLRAQFNNGQALNYGAVVGKFVGKAVNPKKVKSSVGKKILKGK